MHYGRGWPQRLKNREPSIVSSRMTGSALNLNGSTRAAFVEVVVQHYLDRRGDGVVSAPPEESARCPTRPTLNSTWSIVVDLQAGVTTV